MLLLLPWMAVGMRQDPQRQWTRLQCWAWLVLQGQGTATTMTARRVQLRVLRMCAVNVTCEHNIHNTKDKERQQKLTQVAPQTHRALIIPNNQQPHITSTITVVHPLPTTQRTFGFLKLPP